MGVSLSLSLVHGVVPEAIFGRLVHKPPNASLMARILRFLLLLGILCSVPFASAQRGVAELVNSTKARGTRFVPVPLMERVTESPATDALWSKALDAAVVLKLSGARSVLDASDTKQAIVLELPTASGSVVLDLVRVYQEADGFQVRVASSGTAVPVCGGAHYRGTVRGAPEGFAAISIYSDMVMGLVVDAQGQWVLGPFDEAPKGYHVFYRDSDLKALPSTSCSTPKMPPAEQPNDETGGGERTIRCVGYYWEVAYDIFQNKGSVVATANYITGLFNQSATLFLNDDINVNLTEVFVWDVPSPYNAGNSGGRLDQFGVQRTSFNGDMAHLLDLANYGGVAYLSTICNSQTRYRMAYSGIDASFSNVPTYSWSVNVVTHEQGHNLGSAHTHACSWNGNNTAIDGCGPSAGYSEGSCAQGPLPTTAVGGTIMSYCHLTSSKIKFVNGFGPQPAARIRDRVNSSACLANCGSSCDAPGSLFVSNLSTTVATLNWLNVGATSYDVEWRAVGASQWILVSGITGTNTALSGLLQGTAYEFRVRSVCGASQSSYGASFGFTTLVPCPDALEPNNTLGTAADIAVPATVSALIASPSDLDYYRVVLTQAGTLTIQLTGLAADYDLRLLSASGAQLALSQNGGTSYEYISYAASAGTYIVYVYGYAGAFSAVQCYTLYVNLSPNSCSVPDSLAAVDISWYQAGIDWSTVQGTSGYDLQWRQVGQPEWSTVVASTSERTLTDLQPMTEYQVRVRSRCTGLAGTQGTTFSAYGEPITFTTLAVPCEVQPPIKVAVQLLLDAPYDEGTGLMSDALRAAGLIPAQEPYTDMGFIIDGVTTLTPALLAVTGANAVVDWVMVELRDAADPATVLECRAGLLLRNGKVVRPDTGSDTLFFCTPAGSHHLAVRHRNHLGCMTGAPRALGSTPASVLFQDQGFVAWGSNGQRVRNGVRLLWSGNSIADSGVKYTGMGNDRDAILNALGGMVPTTTISGYLPWDINLDGLVKYTGQDNDRDPILQTIGGVVPTTVRAEQLP